MIPIYNNFIEDVKGEHVTLNITLDDLYSSWNKTVKCGLITYPTDELLEKPVYERNHSRIGTFFVVVERDGPSNHNGILVDPYLCDIWKTPFNKLMPIPTDYITNVKDTIYLNKSLDELKRYCKQHFDH